MSTLYENIISLCDKKGIKGGKMCTDLGISKGLLTDLKMGRRFGVSAVTAQKIASYFDVSVGYLLGEEKESDARSSDLDARPSDSYSEALPKENTNSKIRPTPLSLSQHELNVITAYRLHPEFQSAVDHLLGVENDGYVQIYSAASSKDNHPDQIITIKKKEWEKIKSAKDTDDPLL